jgi:hypothetical protein
LFGFCEGLNLELPGPLLKLSLVSLFSLRLFTVRAWGAARLPGPFFTYRLLYIAVHSDHDFSPHLLFPSFNHSHCRSGALVVDLVLSLLVLLSFDFFVVLSDVGKAFSSRLAKQRYSSRRLLLPAPHSEVTQVTDLKVAPAVTMKKAGLWTHARLSVAMTSGPRSLPSATSDSWRP